MAWTLLFFTPKSLSILSLDYFFTLFYSPLPSAGKSRSKFRKERCSPPLFFYFTLPTPAPLYSFSSLLVWFTVTCFLYSTLATFYTVLVGLGLVRTILSHFLPLQFGTRLESKKQRRLWNWISTLYLHPSNSFPPPLSPHAAIAWSRHTKHRLSRYTFARHRSIRRSKTCLLLSFQLVLKKNFAFTPHCHFFPLATICEHFYLLKVWKHLHINFKRARHNHYDQAALLVSCSSPFTPSHLWSAITSLLLLRRQWLGQNCYLRGRCTKTNRNQTINQMIEQRVEKATTISHLSEPSRYHHSTKSFKVLLSVQIQYRQGISMQIAILEHYPL